VGRLKDEEKKNEGKWKKQAKRRKENNKKSKTIERQVKKRYI
jgi:hypothetical protein